MFSYSMQEQQQVVVRIDDLRADTVHHLVQSLYTGTTRIATWKEAAALLHAADKYELSRLKDWCIELLRRFLSLSTVSRTVVLIKRITYRNLYFSAVLKSSPATLTSS